MNTVIEIDKARQRMDPGPLDRLTGTITLPHRLERRRYRPHLRMAVHAHLSRRYAGKARIFDARMSVTAIDTQPAGVVLMTERHPRLILPRLVRRPHNHRARPHHQRQGSHRTKQHQAKNGVGFWMKVPWHLWLEKLPSFRSSAPGVNPSKRPAYRNRRRSEA